MTPAPSKVRINRTRFPFTSYAEASAAYRKTIDTLGLGASEAPNCDILDTFGRPIGYVSYNGRVWIGNRKDWASSVCVYDPR